MIQAEFTAKDDVLSGFTVKGHALFDQHGRDIVCAAVSSAVQLTANGITEVLGESPQVIIKENQISLKLTRGCKPASDFLEALKLHLSLLSEDYPGTIEITILEV